MKRKDILLLTLLLTQTAPVWGMEPEKDESVKTTMATSTIRTNSSDETRYVPKNQASVEVQKLQDAIQDIKDRIKQKAELYPNTQKSVIILGPKGSGKTTLLHGLAGKQLRVEESPWGRRICLEDKSALSGESLLQNTTGITNTAFGIQALMQNVSGEDNRAVKGSSEPSLWYDETDNTAYWECPGWDDQLEPEQDIINAWSIKHLLDELSGENRQPFPFNVFLTISEAEFDQGTSFLNLLNKMTDIFQDDEQLQKSCSLIVTKQQNIKVQELLSLILRDQTILNPRTRALLEFFSQNNNHVLTIPRPQQGGEYHFDRKGILDCLKTSEGRISLYRHETIFKPAVNFKSQIFINNIVNDLNENIANYLTIEMVPIFLNACKKLIDIHVYPIERLTQLRTHFDHLKEKLLNLQKEPKELAENLKKSILFSYVCLSDFNKESYVINAEDIRKIIDQLKFLKTMKKYGHNFRLMSRTEDLNQIKPGELGLICENDKLYFKIHNKEKIEIIPSNNPTSGLHSQAFYSILKDVQLKLKYEGREEQYQFPRLHFEVEKTISASGITESLIKDWSNSQLTSGNSEEYIEKLFQYAFIKGYTCENVVYQTASWFQPLLKTIEKIEHLAKEPKIEFSKDTLTINGLLVCTEDVFLAMKKIQVPKIINIFGLNTIFIDESFKSPGSSLNIIAPHIKVIHQREINLNTTGKALELSFNTGGSVNVIASIGESLNQCTFYINGEKEGKLASELIHVDNPNETICPYLMQNPGQGLTPLEIQSSVQQLPVEGGPLAQAYNHFYFQQAMDPHVAPFMKTFQLHQEGTEGFSKGARVRRLVSIWRAQGYTFAFANGSQKTQNFNIVPSREALSNLLQGRPRSKSVSIKKVTPNLPQGRPRSYSSGGNGGG